MHPIFFDAMNAHMASADDIDLASKASLTFQYQYVRKVDRYTQKTLAVSHLTPVVPGVRNFLGDTSSFLGVCVCVCCVCVVCVCVCVLCVCVCVWST